MAILGILAAIAVPSFLGAKESGFDSHAQSNLRSALAAERTHYVDYQAYTTDAATLRAIEANVDYTTTDASVDGVMAATSGTQVVVMVSVSESDTMFCIMNIASDLGGAGSAVNGQHLAGTYYARKTTPVATPPTSVAVTACDGPYTRSGW